VGDAYLRIIIARITRLSTRELWLTISMACRTCATCSSVFSGWTSVVFDTSVSISIIDKIDKSLYFSELHEKAQIFTQCLRLSETVSTHRKVCRLIVAFLGLTIILSCSRMSLGSSFLGTKFRRLQNTLHYPMSQFIGDKTSNNILCLALLLFLSRLHRCTDISAFKLRDQNASNEPLLPLEDPIPFV
jgi:hypothetical protein